MQAMMWQLDKPTSVRDLQQLKKTCVEKRKQTTAAHNLVSSRFKSPEYTADRRAGSSDNTWMWNAAGRKSQRWRSHSYMSKVESIANRGLRITLDWSYSLICYQQSNWQHHIRVTAAIIFTDDVMCLTIKRELRPVFQFAKILLCISDHG